MDARRTLLAVAVAVWAAPRLGGAEGPRPPAPDGKTATAPAAGAAPSADRALVEAGTQVTNDIHVERARATRLQMVLTSLRYGERLALLEERGAEERTRAASLQERLEAAHHHQFATLTVKWPVDTYRGCSYPALEFGSMLDYGKTAPADLERHRVMLRACVEQARSAVALMKESNDGLEAAMRDTDAALAAAGVGSPSAGDAAAPARDRRERAEHEGEHEKGHDPEHDRGERR